MNVCMETDNSSLKQYETKYCMNFIMKYFGEKGFLIGEDGTELPCKFEAGQLENGKIILICDCSILDLDRKNFFPELYSKNVSAHNLRLVMSGNISSKGNQSNIFQQLEKLNSFNGITSDGFNITGKVRRYINTDYGSSNYCIKLEYYLNELILNAKEKENIQYMVFGITNFKFIGNPIKLDIKGTKGLTIQKRKRYDEALDFLKISKGSRVTCDLIVELDNYNKKLEEIVDDLCDIMSIALGTRVQWIYYSLNSEEKIVSWKHVSKVTKPCYFTEIIDYRDLKNFLESSYVALAEKSNLLRHDEGTAKPLINAYLDAKAENDYLEGRGIKLVVVMEMLKDSFTRYKPMTQSIINKNCFSSKKSAIKSALKEAIELSVKKESEEKSEQEKVKIINEIQEIMFAKISEINKISFKEILQNLCDAINLQIDPKDLQSVIDSRNKLIHEGKFLCKADSKKEKYTNIKDYPQFKDPEHEYFFLMNFVDQCFLKLLHYKGYYYKWESVHDIKRVELK